MKIQTMLGRVLVLLMATIASASSDTLEEQLNKAQTLFERDDFEQALEIYDHILDATPVSKEARIGKARCLSRLDRRSLAMQEINEVLKRDPEDRDALLAKGSNLARMGNHDQAIFLFKQILKKYPDDIYAWYNLGTSQREVNQHNEALESFYKVRDLHKQNEAEFSRELRALLHYQMGLIFMNQQEFQEAKDSLHEAIEIAPWLENARYQLGMAYARLGDTEKSREWLDSFQELKNTRNKIDRMKRLASKHPQAATPYIGMGQLYLSIENLKKAQSSLVRALERDENNPHALTYMGFLYLKTDQTDQARDLFEAALQSDPRNALALVNLGSLEMKEENFEAAEEYYRRALQIQPNFRPARQGYQQLQQMKANIQNRTEP